MSPPLLEVRGIRREFPGVVALDDMDLELRDGEVLAVVGENGAGKSTLMNVLSGVHRPDAGEIRIDGRPVRIGDPRRARELGIAIIHQEFTLIPDLTVAQNVLAGREPRRAGFLLDERALVARTRALLDRLELPLDPHATVASLTVAQQQMVEIAKALADDDARILIMDEPTAALDDAEVEVLHALIRRFRRPGTGVVYISHRLEELAAVTDRITVVRDGRHAGTLDTAGASMAEVITRMVGRELPAATAPATVPERGRPLLAVRGLCTPGLLRDVSFDLHEGEILGVAGLMGAGRTEVARALVGADRPSAGTVELRGRAVRIGSPAVAARLGLGYLSEDRKQYGLLLDRSVTENVVLSSLASRFSGAGVVRRRAAERRTAELVESLHIRTPSVHTRVGTLSGGNQQKVVIARWLARDCDVLVFDEPTRGIDVGAKDEIYRLVRELAATGKAVVVISSELPEVLRLSHRVLVMSEGRVTGQLEATDATQESIMELATLRPGEPDRKDAGRTWTQT
ncbi:sugar ABC transporter ATP-binding protein [Pseudonocardia sp. HH130630-07]|uniref:sugar ABC transporter ATP-binding protein n=1 Tax=Pseudonocardia sp. HH130630-07 TaxID=1690815 RepID=UPI000814DA3A|nr:sugar ABC transporter ATP-binding protein [Pseudonocardia sp. HH130630-07]ANY08344.1 D-ribose transporter ATP-binding protein [Pseudonocardia sp. HH130630-07]